MAVGRGLRQPALVNHAPAGRGPTGFDPARGLHILQHSLGVDKYGHGRRYRNHFVTGPGSVDYPDCCALCGAGLMVRGAGSPLSGGDDVFSVTRDGERYVTENSPSPPPESRGQRRYRKYLEADSSLTFGEWLKSPWARGA